MKTQLLSNLTDNKVWKLLFLIFLCLKQGNAGNGFRNCLRAYSDNTSYNLLIKYPFSTNNAIINGISLFLCCDKQCTITTSGNCKSNEYKFTCRRLLGNVVCTALTIANYGCQGIIGEQAITTNGSVYGSACPISIANRDQFSLIENLISNNLKDVEGLTQGYADYDCQSDYCLQGWCDWDNGGWMCSYPFEYENSTDVCYMQWPAPWLGPANKNPFTAIPTSTITIIPSRTETTTMTITKIATSTLPISTATPAPANHLAEKIVITIGAVAGTSIISGLTYYLCRKHKEQKLLVNNSNHQLTMDNLKIEVTQSEENRLSGQIISPKDQLLNQQRVQFIEQCNVQQKFEQLRTKLIGHEQLWTDYLDANNWLINNSQSQLASREFAQLQNELLQTFTMNDLTLLLENETTKQARNPHTDYFEIKEELRSAQGINILTENNYRHPQTEYFEVRDPQGVSNYHC